MSSDDADETSAPTYHWTKVWGRPGEPSADALLFRDAKTRDRRFNDLNGGDIVVYLTGEVAQADPMIKGHVSGAVEIAGDKVSAEELGIVARARPEDFREDGRFRWPYGITIRRSWRTIDKESNTKLIADHARYGQQAAADIHRMRPDEIVRFLNLMVREQAGDGAGRALPFQVSRRRPWKQKAGPRKGAEVEPGCDFYIAVFADKYGMTYKVGSGKWEERIAALNLYRRRSQGEAAWSKILNWEFRSVEAARAAEDHLLKAADRFASRDHSEFLVGIEFRQVKELFSAAVEHGSLRDAELAADRPDSEGNLVDLGGAGVDPVSAGGGANAERRRAG